MAKKRRPKVKLDPEFEAAWYVLCPFISPFDFVTRYQDENNQKCINTANPKPILAAQHSGNKLFKAQMVTKSKFPAHFSKDVIIFYKSHPYKRLSTGYGRRDADARNLPFSQFLNITTKRITDTDYYVLLIGFDIDCHNGENHVVEVMALIISYFPDTYWEISTNGAGRHGYLKIKYRQSKDKFHNIVQFLDRLFKKLRELKTLFNYEALIDDPGGLPYETEFVDTNPHSAAWNTLFYTNSQKQEIFLGRFVNPDSPLWYDYLSYLKEMTTFKFPRKCNEEPGLLQDYLEHDDIKNSFSSYLSHSNTSFPAPVNNNSYYKISCHRACKLPLFGASELSPNPVMTYIKQFYESKYYTSSDLDSVYTQLCNDITAYKKDSDLLIQGVDRNNTFSKSLSSFSTSIDNKHLTSDSKGGKANPDDEVVPVKAVKAGEKASCVRSQSSLTTETSNNTAAIPVLTETSESISAVIKIEEEVIGYNCACTNTQNLVNNSDLVLPDESPEDVDNLAEYIEWCEIDVGNEKERFVLDDFWKKYHQEKQCSSSSKYEEIVENLKSENNTMRRSRLFIRAFIHKRGRLPGVVEAEAEYVKVGLNRNTSISSHNRQKRFQACISYYANTFKGEKLGIPLNWVEDKIDIMDKITSCLPETLTYQQGSRQKTIKVEEIGYVYYLIQQMDGSEQNTILSNTLSYSQVDDYFISEFRKKCGRHKFSGILKLLLQYELIEKVGNYKVGLRGNCYRVIK